MAPALAAATCGVAMGAAGTDAAIEAADVALMADDLSKILTALAFGETARGVSMQNIVQSIAVLIAMIPLAVVGVIGVATAVLVHESAELLAGGERPSGRSHYAAILSILWTALLPYEHPDCTSIRVVITPSKLFGDPRVILCRVEAGAMIMASSIEPDEGRAHVAGGSAALVADIFQSAQEEY